MISRYTVFKRRIRELRRVCCRRNPEKRKLSAVSNATEVSEVGDLD